MDFEEIEAMYEEINIRFAIAVNELKIALKKLDNKNVVKFKKPTPKAKVVKLKPKKKK